MCFATASLSVSEDRSGDMKGGAGNKDDERENCGAESVHGAERKVRWEVGGVRCSVRCEV